MIIPQSLEELASYVEQEERRFSSFQRIGVAIAGISSPFCQRLKQKTLNLPSFWSTETSI